MHDCSPGVLLVEDDASIRRFVCMALEGVKLRLLEAPSLQTARQLLTVESVALMLVDLMLPDGNGLEFIAERVAMSAAAKTPPPRVILFSAGISAQTRATARNSGVWRVMEKPVPLGELLSEVQAALASETDASPEHQPSAGQQEAHRVPNGREAALHEHFAGHAELFDAFRRSALTQFGLDMAAIDRAFELNDWAAVRREAHSLKSVLQLIGEPAPAASAARLEAAARVAASTAGLRSMWAELRAGLGALMVAHSTKR